MNLFDRTITIFNRAEGEEILSYDTWHKTVLHGVRVIERMAKGNSNAFTDNDSVTIHVFEKTLDKPYKDPKEWQALLDKTEAFTLTQGQDFIVLGDVSDVDTEAIDLFASLKERYDGVYRITSVNKFTAIPHLEIGGR